MQEPISHNSISLQAADKLIAAHDGDVALLYLYWVRNGDLDEEKAARALCRTLQEIRTAEEKLRRLDLLEKAAAPAVSAPAPAEPAPVEELPQYTAAEITRRTKGDGAFSVILDEAAKVMGKALGGNDTRMLFGIYDYLGLPAEVILELLHYCQELCRLKYKDSRRPTARFIEQEAYAWANREILTLEQAEEYIHRQKQRRSDMGRLQEALGLQGHTLSPTQEKDLSAWLDQGFPEEAVLLAYDRTVTNTGSLKWGYMRKILQSWHEKGLHTPKEIEEKDSLRSRKASPPAPVQNQKALDRRALEELLKNT